jgi:hypothetical protein
MAVGKRKREVTPDSPAKSSGAAHPVTSGKVDDGKRDHKRQKAEVMVVWELADGSRRYERKLGEFSLNIALLLESMSCCNVK